MNLPKYVYEHLATKFSVSDLAIIDTNWDRFIQIRFGDASNAKLVKNAKIVLACTASIV